MYSIKHGTPSKGVREQSPYNLRTLKDCLDQTELLYAAPNTIKCIAARL